MTQACSSLESTSTMCLAATGEKMRVVSRGSTPAALTSIYQENANIAIWERELSGKLKKSARTVLASRHSFEFGKRVTPGNAASSVEDALRDPAATELSHDIAELVDMFCCLFESKYAGLRLTALRRAMCPRFHVDKVPCRLVTTYQGPATQWLPHDGIDRSKLGAGNQGEPDAQSGLYTDDSEIQQLKVGDVALLKGELWEGNEGAGLVHRSPELLSAASRLLLTLDIIL